MRIKWFVGVLLIAVSFLAACEDYDTSNCDQYENSLFNLFERDSCWSQKAEETKDASWCSKQEGPNVYCVANVAHQKGDDLTVCDQYATDKSSCYERVEEYIFDDKIADCNNRWGDNRKIACLVELDLEAGGVDACRDSKDRPLCFATLADARSDASVCDQLYDEEKTSCLALMGETDIPENEEDSGECKYDSDCAHYCSGNTIIKPHCNGRTNQCEDGFEEVCKSETIASFSFQKQCIIDDKRGACERDTDAIAQKKMQLSDEVKELLNARLFTTQLQLDANRNCISAIEDVTNKLIIDTAQKLVSPPSALLDIGVDATMGIIDALASDPDRMSPEEFISLNCNLGKALITDLDLMEKQIDIKQDQVSALNKAS